MPLGNAGPDTAPLLPPRSFCPHEAGLLLGAGAVPDGRGRRASGWSNLCAPRRPPHCCRCSARLAVPVGADRALVGLRCRGSSSSLSRKLREVEAQLVRQTERTARIDQILAENSRLRGLLELRPSLSARSRAAECHTRSGRSLLAKGSDRHRAPRKAWRWGSPVMNEAGVLGTGHTPVPVDLRSDAADRPGRGDPGAERPHLATQRGLRWRRRRHGDGTALHVGQRRCAAGRCTGHQRPGRRLPAGSAGGHGDHRRPPGRLGLRPGDCSSRPRRADASPPRAGARAPGRAVAAATRRRPNRSAPSRARRAGRP
jgi:hypothetical protein